MRDIENSGDIKYLVETFYSKALKDELIGPVFKAVHFSLEQHIPIMINFWETILLDIVTYRGNPMVKHLEMNKILPLESKHFDRWNKIWKETVTASFNGLTAQQAINRAEGIADLIQHKIKKLSQPR